MYSNGAIIFSLRIDDTPVYCKTIGENRNVFGVSGDIFHRSYVSFWNIARCFGETSVQSPGPTPSRFSGSRPEGVLKNKEKQQAPGASVFEKFGLCKIVRGRSSSNTVRSIIFIGGGGGLHRHSFV